MSTPGKIYEAMSAIMLEVPAISKDRQGHGYKFRGIDDVYAALNAILAKHKVFTVPKVLRHTRETHPSNAGKDLLYSLIEMEYTFFAEDGSFVTSSVIGEGMDSGDKASNKAMSVAHKYALLQVFAIPTEDAKDPENDNPMPGQADENGPRSPSSNGNGARPQLVSEAQLKRLFALQKKHGVTDAQVDSHIKSLGLTSRKDLNRQQYDALIAKIEAVKKS